MASPLVSVIVPTYRRDELLREAVVSALAQSVSDIEVLVVEDGSNTGVQVVRGLDPRVRYLWKENGGVSTARNLGAAHAAADWLAFLDDDDTWLPSKLERQLALAQLRPEFDMIHTDYVVRIGEETRPGPRLLARDLVPSGEVGRTMFLNNFVITSSVMLKRSAFEQAGGFSPQFAIVQDYDLWLRISRAHQIGFVNESLVVYRDHESLSSRTDRIARERAEALAAFVASNPQVVREYGAAVVRTRLSETYWQAGYAHFLGGDLRAASRLFFAAWRWKRAWLKPALYAAACMTGPKGIRLIELLRGAKH
jgi:glycosyltransferase involved in cell wall biosynthesis